MGRPIIGVVLDWEETGSFAARPYFALRENYFTALQAHGALPIALPFLGEETLAIMAKLDGLLVPGSGFTSQPGSYVDEQEPDPYPTSDRSTQDIRFIQAALQYHLPILGICGGMQQMALAQGGKLVKNLFKATPNALAHNSIPAEEMAHSITITPNTLLARCVKESCIDVNSRHKEAVVEPGNGVIVSAMSPDGVIEAIELKDAPFALGVEWHPEFFAQTDGPNARIFKHFIGACHG